MIRLTAALFFMATTANACPTFDDLETGVVFRDKNQGTYAVRQVAGDLYWHGQMSDMFPDQWQSFKHLGGFELYTQRDSGTGKQQHTYSYDVTALDEIVDGLTFASETQWGDPSGARVWVGDYDYRVEPRDAVTIGDCTYAALSIISKGDMTLPSGEVRENSETKIYLPELRFILPFFDMASVAVATPDDAVPSLGRLLELGADTSVLGEILMKYGMTP